MTKLKPAQPYWEVFFCTVLPWCLNLPGRLCSELYQRSFLVLHTSLTLYSGARNVNGRQETSVSDLPIHLGLGLVIARCAFYIHIVAFCHSTTNRRVRRLVLFRNTLKTYAGHMRCQLQTYLNTSVMMAISHPTVIYLWLFGLSAFGARDKEKTTRSVYAWIIEEHWASCQYVEFYPRMKHSVFVTWLSNHIT